MKAMVIKLIKVALIVAVVLWVASEFGLLQFFPDEGAADARLKKRAHDGFSQQQSAVEAANNFDEAARLNREAKAELARKLALVYQAPQPQQQYAPPVQQPSAPASNGVVVNDANYASVQPKPFAVLVSDIEKREYRYWLDGRETRQDLEGLPTPQVGEIRIYSFSEVLVCALGAPCTDQRGWVELLRRPGDLRGEERTKYNADDFPAQSAIQEEAVVYTGDGEKELGKPLAWVVTPTAAGKRETAGFNVRKSEAKSVHGGGVLTIVISRGN